MFFIRPVAHFFVQLYIAPALGTGVQLFHRVRIQDIHIGQELLGQAAAAVIGMNHQAADVDEARILSAANGANDRAVVVFELKSLPICKIPARLFFCFLECRNVATADHSGFTLKSQQLQLI